MPLKIERTHSRTLSGKQSNYKQSSDDWTRRLHSLLPSRRSPGTYHDKPRHEAWPIPPREVPRAVYYGSPERKKRHVSLHQFPDSRRSTPLYSNQTTPTHSTDSSPYHSRQPSFEALYMKSRGSMDDRYGVLHRDPSVSMTRSRSSNKEARFAETRYTGEQAVMTGKYAFIAMYKYQLFPHSRIDASKSVASFIFPFGPRLPTLFGME